MKKIYFICEGNPDIDCGEIVKFDYGEKNEIRCQCCGTIYTSEALRCKESRAKISNNLKTWEEIA